MTEQTFSARVLQDLRSDGYRPRAWWGLLSGSWRQARATAVIYPQLTNDWRWLTAKLGLATLGTLAYTTQRHGWWVARRSAMPLVFATMLQSGDIYVHLGLHRRGDGVTFGRLGTATTLTALRGWMGAVIGSRLLSGMPLTDDEALVALLLILATDVADGRIARHQEIVSALGGYLDGEADLVAWTVLTLTQLRRGQVPRWFVGAFGLRWGLPLIVGICRTFMTAAPMTLAPSRFARAVGAAQVVTAATALVASSRADKSDARWWVMARQGLVATTGVLLVATTVHSMPVGSACTV